MLGGLVLDDGDFLGGWVVPLPAWAAGQRKAPRGGGAFLSWGGLASLPDDLLHELDRNQVRVGQDARGVEIADVGH